MTETSELREVPRMSSEEIKKTCYGLVRGNVFVASMAPSDLWPMIFMPIGLGGLGNIDPESIGNIVEDISKAGPRSINGYPCFFSCQVVHKDDWAIIVERTAKMQAALDAAFKDTPAPPAGSTEGSTTQ